MTGIIRKDMLYYLGNLALLPLMLLYWYATRTSLDTTVVFMSSGWLFIVVLGAIIGIEVNESRNRGYDILASLPIRPAEIAAAKLLPVLAMTGLYSATVYFMFAGFESDPSFLAMARKWLLFNSAAAVCTAGLIYWFVFRFGLEKAVYLQGALLMVALLAPIAMNELVIRGYVDLSWSIFRITGSPHILLAGLAVLLVFYRMAVDALERGAAS